MSGRCIDIIYISGAHGGFENNLNQTAEYLKENGYRIRFVQMLDSGVSWTTSRAEYVCLHLDRNNLDLERARQEYAALLKGAQKPPVMILATGWPYVVYVAKGAATDASTDVPVVAWLHGDLHYYEEGGCGGVDMLRFADACFAISDRIAKDIIAAYPGKPVLRIHNPYDPDRVCFSEKRDTKELAYIGRLSEEKAVPIIFHALAKTRDLWELYIAGEGDGEKELRSLAKQLGITRRIHFLGWLDKPFAHLTSCRAILISSLYEGAPLSAVEGLASGMQLISTPVGNVEELIGNTDCGYIVPFGEPDALTRLLNQLAGQPFSPEMARACRDIVSGYTPEKTLREFQSWINICIGSAKSC